MFPANDAQHRATAPAPDRSPAFPKQSLRGYAGRALCLAKGPGAVPSVRQRLQARLASASCSGTVIHTRRYTGQPDKTAKWKGPIMNENSNQTGGRSTRGDTARDLVAQSMYNLVRLTRLGVQAAASGIGRLEESMARRQRERAETRPTGEAPPSQPTGASTSEPSVMSEEAGEKPGEIHRPGTTQEPPGQSRH